MRSWLIYPEIQLRLMAVNLVAVMGVGASALVGLFLATRKLQALGLKGNLPAEHPFFQFLALQNASIFGTVTVVLVVAIVASVIGTLLVSHRMVGPIYRIRKDLTEVAAGKKVQPIRLREGDYLHELVELINRLALSPSRAARKRPAPARKGRGSKRSA
jgi:uncharacterized protein YneF (UPF0154 family)